MKKFLSAFFVFALFFIPGCAGYRLGSIGGQEIQGVKSVYVPMVKNESLEPGLQTVVTNAIIRRFDNDGTLQTLNTKDADSDLQVKIKQIRRTPTRSSRNNLLLTQEYSISIEAEATFTNRRLGKKIFENRGVNGRTVYYVQNDQQESERQALPMAADDLANNVVKMITEGW